ncbi:MAG: hypothetical protein AAFN40_25285 [Cyanobacteria bacterium J06560_6]
MLVESIVAAAAQELANRAFKGIGKKYSVDIQDVEYIINSQIQDDFKRCLDIALKAFISFINKDIADSKAQTQNVQDYLLSTSVSEEVWHLLDPGAEYFDRGKLTQIGHEVLSKSFDGLSETQIFDAWEEFLKAFSFASRSTPEFREFLRASYEAGSFKALSNIDDALEKMGAAINEIKSEESAARQSISDYVEELRGYRNWATNFQPV